MKEKRISELSTEMSQMKQQIDKLLKENKEKEIEEILIKEKYDTFLEKIIKDNNNLITQSKINYIIGEYYCDSFVTVRKIIQSETQYNILIDFKSFIKLYYSKDNLYLIEDIEKKHIEEIKKIASLNINKLILLVDFVFLMNIIKIMNTHFKEKDLIIKAAYNGTYRMFLLSFEERTNSENKCSFLFKENILSYEEINLNEIPNSNLYNFINYYYEINEYLDKNNLEYFPIYEPSLGNNHFFLTMKTSSCKNENFVILICAPLIDYEDLILDFYESSYKYIIILFQAYYFEYNENISDAVSQFFFKKNADFTVKIPENMEEINDGKDQYLASFIDPSKNKLAIIDKNKARVLFKFKANKIENKKYKIEVKNVIDKKIKIMTEKINQKNDKFNDILIEEQFNIIYSYLNDKYKESNIILLNGNKNEENENIRKIISTSEIQGNNNYLLEFLNNNKDSKFDLIISCNSLYLEDENKIKHKFLKKEKLENIKIHLNENGIFCFYLFLNNKYLEEKIREKLEIVFDKENICIYNHKLDYIILCIND